MNYEAQKLNLPESFTYTAHSGCENTPDNSLLSIEEGAKSGAKIVEVDLQNFLGVPVLSHGKPDETCERLENAFLKLKEYEGLRMNVDAKTTKNIAEVEKLAKKIGVEKNIFFTGLSASDTKTVKRECPNTKYYLNVKVIKPSLQSNFYLNCLVKKVKNSGAIGINLDHKNCTKRLVEIFQSNGLSVSLWTASSREDILKCLYLSPNNITTRTPRLLSEILEEKRSDKS